LPERFKVSFPGKEVKGLFTGVKTAAGLDEIISKTLAGGKYYPVSVYRLQFNGSFTFIQAAGVVPYLADLGITDCYSSPFFQARKGSIHGYDISDQNKFNPEIGTEDDYYNKFSKALSLKGMSQIVDVVPNHMSIFNNPKWRDILENGQASIYGCFFDIDWDPVNPALHNRVLLPVLEDFYGSVLEKGLLKLEFENGAFSLRYRDHSLPLCPKTYLSLLERASEMLLEPDREPGSSLLELQSIATACKNLPERTDTAEDKVTERNREKEVIKRRLEELCNKNPDVLSAVQRAIASFNGVPGESNSFLKLHELLEKQVYRLSYWRVAGEEINYRRFFDVNELAAVRIEDPSVYRAAHRLVLDLVAGGSVKGLRIDHVDGLYNPSDYLFNLQKDCLTALVMKEIERSRAASTSEVPVESNGDLENSIRSKIPPVPFEMIYLIVEKILEDRETLRKSWPVDGTTGYEFLTALDRIFVDGKRIPAIREIYRRFTENYSTFEEIVYRSKKLLMNTTMAAEVNLLANRLYRLSNRSWQYRDFTLNGLQDVIREAIAGFPVYRTYIEAKSGIVDATDKSIIEHAIRTARRSNPALSSAIFDFLSDTLLLRYPPGMDEKGRLEQQLFVMRFQQFTGPVMAKGLEDTAFYIYNPLVSLCEVGGMPNHGGSPAVEFHDQNKSRSVSAPHSIITTSTHDTKRGEDVRARINVLSEIPSEWRSALSRWSRINSKKKVRVNGDEVPDKNEEYLLYQTLLGSYPGGSLEPEVMDRYTSRIGGYMQKAIKEAKVHTSWISPDSDYEKGVSDFVEAVLDPSPDNRFLPDFFGLNNIVLVCGRYNSLSSITVKFFSPGTPDIYQGNELWTYSLTDPDNRAAVDFSLRKRILKELVQQIKQDDLLETAQRLLQTIEDGRIKLFTTMLSLNYRKRNRQLFEGSYLPLKAGGKYRENVFSFAYREKEKELIVAVPRLIARLTRKAEISPLGIEAWQDSSLLLGNSLKQKQFRNIFTGETLNASSISRQASLQLADIFKSFPVAALESI